jgi:hypothetical protein
MKSLYALKLFFAVALGVLSGQAMGGNSPRTLIF